jgi:hypothetical protein
MTQQKTFIMSTPEIDVSLYRSLRPDKDGLKAMETWGVMMDECRRETFGFMAKRMEKDGAAFRQALGCPSLQDLLAFHVQWTDDIVRDYSAELTKILAICTTYGADAAHLRPQ